MTDPRQYQFWEEEERNLWDVLQGILLAAYMGGVTGAADSLPPNIQPLLDYNLVNQSALRWAREYRYTWIKGITDTSRTQTQQAIADWIVEGSPLSALEARLAPIFGKARAEMIAATEVTRVYAQANMDTWESTEVVGGSTWMTAQDDLVCPICGDLDGTHIGVGDIDAAPPAHPGCLLPWNEVIAPDLVAASQSFYSGPVVEITTRSGRRLSVTHNHPILSAAGWVSADKLRKGDNLIVASNPQRIAASINPDNDNRPTKIEQVFSSFKKSSGVVSATVPVTPEYFNGDGRHCDGDVNIVYSDSLLSHYLTGEGKAKRQPIREFFLRWRRVAALSFYGLRSKLSLSNSRLASFGGNVGGADLGVSSLLAHSVPLDTLGFGLVSGLNAITDEFVSKGSSADTQLASKFILRFASEITPDVISDIRYYNYSGHVYDLQCGIYELYTCNGIITHNCRCYLQPRVSEKMVHDKIARILAE